ncbi:TolC family protein [Adhaeribacter rhizoryzae]|uniref:TolC family protein n=1 Tax=Adhaeribacter rhizoryzae TaxID=2607907 RepID=A0A5M6DR00_9BACT|nr:TolC family protein [Adhaeribacter rhizoryzae]KAA5548672.1 TolC family protein [Adhaeribacter rhizoryzae]
MKIFFNFFLFLLMLFGAVPGLAQVKPQIRLFTLPEVVRMAKENSPSYRYTSVLFENRQWQYKTFKANFFPQLNLNGYLPEYNKNIVPVLQPNGSIIPQPNHSAASALALSLGQEVWFTGGYISINSNINRFDDFIEGSERIPRRYTAVPATITFNQPFFGYRWLKWENKVQPLRYEEARREYWERMEGIAEEATSHFFNLLLSQISYQIAEKNVSTNQILYKNAEERFSKGTMPENELLQIELSLMNSRQNLEQTTLDVEASTLRLKIFLGLTDDDPITLVPPAEIPEFAVDEKFALEQAHKYRQRMIGFKRELVEADMTMARAKGETGATASLFASFGLTQQAKNIPDVYQQLSEQQRLRIGFNIPVMDWGRSDSRLGTAKANLELVKANVEQQRINFDQDIYLNVKRFKVLRNQMAVAKRTDEIAEKRYNLTKDRYLDGQISILDLNVATEERDKATRSYISALRSFWSAYYNLRHITLYDFELNKPIISELSNQ